MLRLCFLRTAVALLATLLPGPLLPAAHADDLLPSGDWSVIQPEAGRLTVSAVDAYGKPGGNAQALHLTVSRPSEPFYAIAIGKNVPRAVKQGMRLRLHFWARSATGGRLRAVVEKNGAPYTGVAEVNPALSPEWKEYSATGTTATAFAAEGLAVRLQVGHQAGEVELAGIALEALGEDPESVAAREAMKPENIRARIRRYRTGDMSIRIVDRQGHPLPDASLTVRQTRSAFLFGGNLFLLDPANTEVWQKVYQDRFTDLLNYATLPFYWGAFEPQQGKPEYERLRVMADWCQAHGLTTKGHPLVWHEVYPRWAPKDADATIPLLKKRVEDLIPRYKGLISVWDVVNEANAAANYDTGISAWAKRNGPAALVQTALGWAREADRGVGATLLYNDYNVGQDNVALLTALQAKKSLPDAIGIQSHMHDGVWPLERVWQVAERFATFGKPMHFTEVTVVSGPRPTGATNTLTTAATDWATTPEGEQQQAQYLEQFYTLLFSHPKVAAITYWDLSDRGAWQGAPAGLLRKDMTPKPAYERLKRLIRNEWTTNTAGRTDPFGRYRLRAYYGEYEITVAGSKGQRVTKTVTFPPGSETLNLTLSP